MWVILVGNSQFNTELCSFWNASSERAAALCMQKDEEAKVLECLQRHSPIYSAAIVLKHASSHSVHLGKMLRPTAHCSLRGQFLARKLPKSSRRRRKDLVSLKFVLLWILKWQDRSLTIPMVVFETWCWFAFLRNSVGCVAFIILLLVHWKLSVVGIYNYNWRWQLGLRNEFHFSFDICYFFFPLQSEHSGSSGDENLDFFPFDPKDFYPRYRMHLKNILWHWLFESYNDFVIGEY